MSRNIDLREGAVRQQEAMGHTVRTGYRANYLARAVDPLRSRGYCPGEIDRGNGLCTERRRECRHRKEGCHYCSTQHELLLGSLLAASGSLSVLPREVVLNVQRQRSNRFRWSENPTLERPKVAMPRRAQARHGSMAHDIRIRAI